MSWSKEASVAGTERWRERTGDREGQEMIGRSLRALWTLGRTLAFGLSEVGVMEGSKQKVDLNSS